MCELTALKECLVSKVYEQFENIETIDTKEMGEAIDMIKDLAQTMYYCSVVEAMKNGEECNGDACSEDEYASWAYHVGAKDSSRCGASRAAYLKKKEENASESYLTELEVYLNDLKNDVKEMATHMNYDEKELVGNHLTILHSEIV